MRLSWFTWNKVSLQALNVIDLANISSMVVLLRKLPHIWISIPLSTKNARACQQQDSFICHKHFIFSTFESIYLIYIKSIQYRHKLKPRISNYMWPHVLRSEVGWNIFIFLVTHLTYIFLFLYMTIVHLLRRWESVWI